MPDSPPTPDPALTETLARLGKDRLLLAVHDASFPALPGQDGIGNFRGLIRTMRFWLDMGVDGLRLDAIPYLIEREGTPCKNLAQTPDIPAHCQWALFLRNPLTASGIMVLGEADPYEMARTSFGKED